MIEQHYYTRENRGYGTVAQSAGLTPDVLKKYILPYCVYPAGEGECLTAVHFPCGRMLLGQAQKNGRAFFQHNYLLPAQAVDEALAAMIAGVKFETSHEAAQGKILPILYTLPTGKSSQSLNEMPTSFDMHYIAQIITNAVATDKKIAILSPSNDVHNFAMRFLAALYPLLSMAARHRLGFCTCVREAVHKKGFHLIFTDTPRIIKDTGYFLVDFARKTSIMEKRRNPADGNTNITEARNIPTGQNPDITDKQNEFTDRYETQSDINFCRNIFTEIKFWLARAPEVVQRGDFQQAVKNRITQIISNENPTPAQLSEIPASFLRQGMNGRYSDIIGHNDEDFLLWDILRRAVHDKKAPDLDAYRLPQAARTRLHKILQSEEFAHDIPPNGL